MFQVKIKSNAFNIINRAKELLLRDIEIRITRAFQKSAKEAVNWAKINHTYTQRTGALNSSTGFQLYKDGSLIDSYFETSLGNAEGMTKGAEAASKRAAELSGNRICVIVVAGMSYAVYVESKGFDVLTSAEQQFPNLLKTNLDILFSGTGISTDIE